MLAIARWLATRLHCTVTGHRMTAARIYYPPAKSMVSGYRCERCGREDTMLYRWQKPTEGDRDG